MKKYRLLFILCLVFQNFGFAKNPIIPNKGANDPHIRFIDGKAYLSASHDKSTESKKFIMEDWWLWSSDDLVNWKQESVLKPGQPDLSKAGMGRFSNGTTSGTLLIAISAKPATVIFATRLSATSITSQTEKWH